jgi:hypothetical protein
MQIIQTLKKKQQENGLPNEHGEDEEKWRKEGSNNNSVEPLTPSLKDQISDKCSQPTNKCNYEKN